MKKHRNLMLWVLSLSIGTLAPNLLEAQQSVRLQATNRVIASSGGHSTLTTSQGNSYLILYTLGEGFIQTALATGVAASFGFHQANDIVLSIADNDLMGLVVTYPNPVTNGVLSIKASGSLELTSYSLYSLHGQEVIQESLRIPQTETHLSVASLAPGAYLLRVKTGDHRSGTFRILIP